MEAAATAVLSSRLKSHASVFCAVDCSLPGLLAGRVEGARISGAAWQSRKNLTCRSLDFRVRGAELDGGALLATGLLTLRAPARGGGAVVFTPGDLGNFLAHPLLAAAAARAVEGRPFAFAPRSVAFGRDGTVRFSGACGGADYACVLHPPPPPPARVDILSPPVPRPVRVDATGGPNAAAVSAGLSRFFSTLSIDLEGTRLRYADVAVAPDAVTLTLRLSLEVTRFPRADFTF